MQLDLDEEEALELKQALDIHLVGLRGELIHTDDRAYRVGERSTLERLEGIHRRLSQLLGAAEPPMRKAG